MTGPEMAKLREEVGLSQEAVAAMLSVSWWSIRNWETGKRGCPLPDALIHAVLCHETAFDLAQAQLRVGLRSIKARKQAASEARKG